MKCVVLLSVLLALVLAGSRAVGEERAEPPLRAEKTGEIVAAIVAQHKGSLGNIAESISTVEVRNEHGRCFVAWCNPFSGRAACFVYAYAWDKEVGAWERYLMHLVEGAIRLRIETAYDRVRIREHRGGLVYEQRSYLDTRAVEQAVRAGGLGETLRVLAEGQREVHARELELSDVPYRIFHVSLGPIGSPHAGATVLDCKGKLVLLCASAPGGLAHDFTMHGEGDSAELTYTFASPGTTPVQKGRYVPGQAQATWK